MRFHKPALAFVIWSGAIACLTAAADAPQPQAIWVDVTPAHQIQAIRALDAVGSTVDKEPAGSIPSLYSKQNVRAMLDAGLGFLSYRLFTELSDQDWHWNPAGRYSAGRQGYWISSSSTSTPPIADSFGYWLTHRGNTTDQGNNENYSRLDDGDRTTYWKSDPYLTSSFTGEPDELHPQWVVVDLASAQPVDGVRIEWSSPYATRYSVDYFTGADPIGDPTNGKWITFPRGRVADGHGESAATRLAATPAKTQFVRVKMTASSNTCDSHGSSDRRNCVGYAIAEISIGSFDGAGVFHDLVRHLQCSGVKAGPYRCSGRQSATYTSSTDPWHSDDRRVLNQEQPGLDLIARSGLTRNIPAFYPVAMLYSTPENAAAEVRYLEARHYAIRGIELGEEPDGQYAEPEDFAALYLQWATAIHAVDPKLKLGGPVFSGVNSDLLWWPDMHGTTSWLTRFWRYLAAHGRSSDLSFMSFEHYPFDGCEHGDKLLHDLLVEPSIVKTVVDAWHADGIPATTPLYVTEAGFSSVNYSQTAMQIEGGLWLADYMGSSLANGVRGAVYYQYEPVPLSQNHGCPKDWGNLTMFVADESAHIRARAAQFYAAQMLTRHWFAPGAGLHALYSAKSNILRNGSALVTAYALKRPDGSWSVMAINKDARPHDVAVFFTDSTGHRTSGFDGSVTQTTFGSDQYVWRARGAKSKPDPNDPPLVATVVAHPGSTFALPAKSITILRGNVVGATQ